MNRIDRLFGILTLLQSRKYVPADKIATRFDISIRTVYRDIKALCEQGIPVSFEPLKGYFIVQGFFLPPVAFTDEEANALLLLEALATGFTDRSIASHYSSAVQKVKSVLKYRQKEMATTVQERIHLQLPRHLKNEAAFLARIQEAIAAKQILELNYKDNKDSVSERRVEPLGLIFYAFSWHLFAWCHLRNDYRDFKVASIQSVRLTGNSFQKQDHLPFAHFVKALPVDY